MNNNNLLPMVLGKQLLYILFDFWYSLNRYICLPVIYYRYVYDLNDMRFRKMIRKHKGTAEQLNKVWEIPAGIPTLILLLWSFAETVRDQFNFLGMMKVPGQV